MAEPQSVIGVYINGGYLTSLDFVKEFPNLQFVALDRVQVSCEPVWNVSIPVLGTDCPGKLIICYLFYYPNFQLSDLKLTLPTPFKPVILALLLSEPIVPLPRGLDNRGYTV